MIEYKLLPCPFCGEQLVLRCNPGGRGSTHDFYYEYYICPTIECITHNIRVTFEDRAAWNRRAPAEQWRPISEAPEYEEIIMAKAPDGGKYLKPRYGIGAIAHGMFCDWGWTCEPTHWMPLPSLHAPPKEER